MKSDSKKNQFVEKPKFLKRNVIIAITIALLIVFFILYRSFNKEKAQTDLTEQPDISLTDSSVVKGKALSLQYCQSCHLLPEPDLLSKTYWQNVLPQMGLRLGITSHKGQSYESSDPDVAAEDRSYLPPHPAMNENQWQNIIDYYTAAAPSVLPPQNKSAIKDELSSFSVLAGSDLLSRKHLMVTYVKIDNSVKPGRLFAFELYSNQLFLLNNKLEVTDSIHVDGVVVDMVFHNKEILAVTIGKKIQIRDKEKFGEVLPLIVSKSGKMQVKPSLFKDLARPLQVIPADLNGDGRTDYLVCEFGFLTGSLSWMENQGNGTYKRHVLRNLPGSVKAYIQDTKNNGLPDLWVLFGQGDEGIFHFINRGNGNFETKQVVRLPAIYGSTSFEMADINGDGFKDIIYTCGDNGDFSVTLKPYHGVYIFTNDGKNNFEQKYFYPVYGCYKVIARDFGNTGKIDLALIAFFTDVNKPEESFVYLKNEGNFNFHPYILPIDKRLEAVLTMDSGDFDNDGKTDLILGNAFPFPGLPGYDKKEPLFVVLKNLGR